MLAGPKTVHQSLFVSCQSLECFLQKCFSLCSQRQCVRAAVGGRSDATREATLVQFVHQADEISLFDAEGRRNFGLFATGVPLDYQQRAELRGTQADRGKRGDEIFEHGELCASQGVAGEFRQRSKVHSVGDGFEAAGRTEAREPSCHSCRHFAHLSQQEVVATGRLKLLYIIVMLHTNRPDLAGR